MKLPKINPLKRTTHFYKSGKFLALDLTENSAKSMHFTKISDKNFSVNGVAIRNTQDKITKGDIGSAVEEVLQQAESSTKDLVLGLSGPNILGFILIVKNKRKEPNEEITNEELENLYDRIKETANLQAEKKWSFICPKESGLAPLDMVVVSTKLDEKIVDDPVDKIGEFLEVAVFCSYSGADYYNWALKQVKSLGFDVLAVTSNLYSQTKLINEVKKNYVLLDIGRKYTDVAIVLGENIIQTKSFGIGGDYFTEHLSNAMSLDYNTANGKKEAYGLKTLPEDESDQIGDDLFRAGKDWRFALASVLLSMNGIKSFPHTVILSGGGSSIGILEELLYEEEWRQEIQFANDIEVMKINTNLWSNYVHDELNVLNDIQMFIPASLGLIVMELGKDE